MLEPGPDRCQCRDELLTVRPADVFDCRRYNRVLDWQCLFHYPAGFVCQVDQDLPPIAERWVSLHEAASFEGVEQRGRLG